jgi:peptidoglycan hydrolase-like protein with peptidoglycan-binding domain
VQSTGDRGTDVVALQHLLRARGQATPVTGYFDSDTRQAVAAYQQSAGLSASGVASVTTWQRLVPTLSQGNAGDAVLALKKQLNAKRGAGLSLTSTFDSATRSAVRSFQQHMGLSATGPVDTATWRNLVWHFDRPNYGLGGLCNYNGGNRTADWGTASTVASLEAASNMLRSRTGDVIAVGDISFEHGGEIRYHNTHEHGLDIDIALIRRDGRQCNNPGISYTHSQYDRAATRAMLRAIHDALGSHLKLIYFNDPQMVSEGLSIRYPNHDDHIHVRVCEAGHQQSRYVC